MNRSGAQGSIRPQLSALHVIAGLGRAHGGPSYSVPRLCRALAEEGIATSLMSVGATEGTTVGGFRDLRFPPTAPQIPGLGGFRVSLSLSAALETEAFSADLIHDHGLWLMPNLAAGREARRAGKPLIVSPRGMLSPAALGFSPWKKRAVWALGQGRMVREAACLHATSDLEYRELRALGLTNPVAVIANGIDVPAPAARASLEAPTVLSLGRLHPKKGLEALLRAWAIVEAGHPAWRLRIMGPSEGGHGRELSELCRHLGLERVSIEDALYGEEKREVFRGAALFVLPSVSENFGLTVAEALAEGIPAIATKGTPWEGLEREGCGWWIEQGAGPLAVALGRAMAMPEQALAAMGSRGRVWMERDFSWARAALGMKDLYAWVSSKGDCPPFVRLK